MTTEVEWRRNWKPDLTAYPWQPIQVDGNIYMIKYKFSQDDYEMMLTDLTSIWYEDLEGGAIQKRVKKLNPGIEAPLTRILDQIKSVLDKTQDDSKPCVKLTFKRDPNSEERRVLVTINSQLAGMPFTWNFQCRPADKSMGSEHLVLPLMAMVGELTRRQNELVKVIQGKDKQIDDYKSQGAKVSRKHLETTPFVETAFEMNMMTSKGFEENVASFEWTTFNVKCQDLYRQVMSKRAWTHRSPSKGAAPDDSLLASVSSQDGKKAGSGDQSWGNSRLPPSLQQSKSPTKSPNKTPSPAKSDNSTPESSPVKDTELLRRQALERRLEMEESKKQEKAKKKKKMAF